MPARPLAAATCALLLVTAFVRLAHADASVEACSSAYTRGQEERLAGRLFAARTEFAQCADSSCPAAIVGDCARWVREVEADLPTVLIAVRSASGAPIERLIFSSDGVSMPSTALLRPVILDAGPHVLRFEAPGYQPLELEKSLRPSDREVEVSVVLRPIGAPTPRLETSSHPAAPAGVPPLALALAGTGVLTLGAALYFDLSSHNQYEDLKSRCAPLCSHADADSVRSQALIGDIALLTSAAAFGGAAWLYFSAQPSRNATAFSVGPRADGVRLRVRLTF